MITHDQILPAVYAMQRRGEVGEVWICAQHGRTVRKLAAAPSIVQAFPRQSFRAFPDPATAVMASELYENRMIAAARGQYINVPSVPKQTLSSILRGRIEEIDGWTLYQMDDAAQAVVHLKRAVGVLP